MKKNKEKKDQGRPPKDIDWKQFEGMCRIHCTKEEIAAILDVDMATIDTRVKAKYGEIFSVVWKRFASEGKMSLRRQQLKRAIEDGDVTMLKWLGIHLLGQNPSIEVKVEKTPTDELLLEARELLKELEHDNYKVIDHE